jgi:hypothetical protein
MRAHSAVFAILLAVMGMASWSTESAGEPRREILEAVLRDDYFPLGSWRVGMKREEALGHFSDVQTVEDAVLYRGVARTHFAAGLPAELTFARGRLQAVKLRLYEGTDFEQAAQRMQEALLFMDAHFAGANFEGGIKTAKDPKGELLRTVLRQTTGKLDGGIRAADEEARKKSDAKSGFTAFEMVMKFWTERVADNNFLLGEYRFRSDTRMISVNLFDDRKFVKSRIPKASVTLFRAAEPTTQD